MLLHLFDDEKFVDATIELFDKAAPNQSKFLIGLFSDTDKIKYVKSVDRIKSAVYGSREYLNEIGDFRKYNAIIFHYLNNPKIEILKIVPDEVKCVWMIWGGDFYPLLSSRQFDLYDKKTLNVLYKISSKNIFTYLIRQTGINKYVKRFNDKKKYSPVLSALNKFSYFTTVLPKEEKLVKSLLKLKASFLPFNYGSFEQFFNNRVDDKFITGDNILIGNSANPTNNHFTAFDLLKNYDLGKRKLILPLSYGGSKEYLTELISCGKKLFGDNFVPLTSFIEKEKYTEIVKSCSAAVMNHTRQQGLGNIIMVLWLGAKVFLNENSLAYAHFNDIGVKVFSVQKDLKGKSVASLIKLTGEEILVNRKAMELYYNQEAVLKRIKYFCETLIN